MQLSSTLEAAWRLNELALLGAVNRISSVSGGSLLSGLWLPAGPGSTSAAAWSQTSGRRSHSRFGTSVVVTLTCVPRC